MNSPVKYDYVKPNLQENRIIDNTIKRALTQGKGATQCLSLGSLLMVQSSQALHLSGVHSLSAEWC